MISSILDSSSSAMTSYSPVLLVLNLPVQLDHVDDRHDHMVDRAVLGLHGLPRRRARRVEDELLVAQAEEFRIGAAVIAAYNTDEYQRGSAYERGEPTKVDPAWMESEDPDDAKLSTGDRES